MTVYSLNTLPEHIKETPFYKERLNDVDDEDLDVLSYDDKDIPILYLKFEDPKFLSRALKIINYWHIDDYPLIVYQYLDENRDRYDDIRSFLEKKLKEYPSESSLYNHFLDFITIEDDNILRWACIVGAYHCIEYSLLIGIKLEQRALELVCIGGFLNCLQLIFSKLGKEEISFIWCTIGAAIGGHYHIMKYVFDEYNKMPTEFKEENDLWNIETTKYAIIATEKLDPECKVFKFIIENGGYWKQPLSRIVAVSGNVKCLKYVIDKKLKIVPNMVNISCGNANRDMLVLYHKNNFVFGYECYVCTIESGKESTADCLRYLLEINCPKPTEDGEDITVKDILKRDDVESLKILIDNDFEFKHLNFGTIFQYNSIKIFEYLVSIEYYQGREFLAAVAEYDKLEYAKILIKNKIDYDNYKPDLSEAFTETELYLFKQGVPFRDLDDENNEYDID